MDRVFYESEIRACLSLLSDTDYVALKIAEDAILKDKYAPVLEKRAGWRARINETEALLNADTTRQN